MASAVYNTCTVMTVSHKLLLYRNLPVWLGLYVGSDDDVMSCRKDWQTCTTSKQLTTQS